MKHLLLHEYEKHPLVILRLRRILRKKNAAKPIKSVEKYQLENNVTCISISEHSNKDFFSSDFKNKLSRNWL